MRISDWSSDVCSSDLDSSQLAAAVNGFVAQAHKGTRTGNIVLHKYLKSTKWAEKALNTEAEDRLTDLVVLFQEYGDRYGFDWLMVGAQGYQESKLDQSARSKAGAIGIMQLLPSPDADPSSAARRAGQQCLRT